uniref:Uncharacterized protein n=1 Tax=Siphoviridae sp. ctE6L85 TaxID=2826202 RepID=A0A8S5QRS4_9CAUD|nr:MAG TPA: hypothetical protein [Siphoviridae sp. ctE6L85]
MRSSFLTSDLVSIKKIIRRIIILIQSKSLVKNVTLCTGSRHSKTRSPAESGQVQIKGRKPLLPVL